MKLKSRDLHLELNDYYRSFPPGSSVPENLHTLGLWKKIEELERAEGVDK